MIRRMAKNLDCIGFFHRFNLENIWLCDEFRFKDEVDGDKDFQLKNLNLLFKKEGETNFFCIIFFLFIESLNFKTFQKNSIIFK